MEDCLESNRITNGILIFQLKCLQDSVAYLVVLKRFQVLYSLDANSRIQPGPSRHRVTHPNIDTIHQQQQDWKEQTTDDDGDAAVLHVKAVSTASSRPFFSVTSLDIVVAAATLATTSPTPRGGCLCSRQQQQQQEEKGCQETQGRIILSWLWHSPSDTARGVGGLSDPSTSQPIRRALSLWPTSGRHWNRPTPS